MNIYSVNLGSEVDEKDLIEVFENFGALSSSGVITDKYSGIRRGFGFIEMENGEEVFVHRSGLINNSEGLHENRKAEFETRQGKKGLYAVNVKSAD